MNTTPLSIRSNPSQDTRSAFASPFVPVNVVGRIRMALGAMRLPSIDRRHISWAAQHVRAMGYELQMGWIHTGRIVAEMVDFTFATVPLRDRAILQSVGIPMGSDTCIPTPQMELTISERVGCTSPNPAGAGLINLCPESLLIRCEGFPTAEGVTMTAPAVVMGSAQASASAILSASEYRADVPHGSTLSSAPGRYNVRTVT